MTPTEIEQFLNVLPPETQLPFKRIIIDPESAIEVKGCTHWLELNIDNPKDKLSFEMYVSYIDDHYLIAHFKIRPKNFKFSTAKQKAKYRFLAP